MISEVVVDEMGFGRAEAGMGLDAGTVRAGAMDALGWGNAPVGERASTSSSFGKACGVRVGFVRRRFAMMLFAGCLLT